MTYPTSPPTAFDYVTFQAGNPTDPLPANEVAGDFADHKLSIDQIIAFSKLVQRSDGNLQNGIVRPESLSSGVLSLLPVGVVFRGAWLTATAYVANDIVSQNGNNYICIVAHTSGTFATDLAAGKWQLADTGFDPTANITLSGTVAHSGANTFTSTVDMTGGTPTVPTASPGDNDTSAASTAFVTAALALATGKVKIQVFTAAGVNTYTPSAGMVNALGLTWGGGGGGGGAAVPGSAGQTGGAGGGGAGSLSIKLMTAAQIGASKVVTIGAAGAAGAAGNNVGGAGGDTSIGSLCIGKGGSGGGGSAGSLNTLIAGGAGGVAGTGDVTSVGMNGFTGITLGLVAPAGGGGSSLLGSGANGISNAGTHINGAAGTGRASGGGGGYTANGDATTSSGGAGTAGYCFILEFCSQ